LGLLVRHGDKLFTIQTLNLELYVGPIFWRQVSPERITVYLENSECVSLAIKPIIMVDCYWNPWRTKLYCLKVC